MAKTVQQIVTNVYHFFKERSFRPDVFVRAADATAHATGVSRRTVVNYNNQLMANPESADPVMVRMDTDPPPGPGETEHLTGAQIEECHFCGRMSDNPAPSASAGVIPKGRVKKSTGWWNRGKIGDAATTPDTAVVTLEFMLDNGEPHEVWEALTDGNAMSFWSKQKSTIQPRVGEVYSYMDGYCSVQNRTLSINDDGSYFIKQKWRLLSMKKGSWSDITYTLTPIKPLGGTKIVFTHESLTIRDPRWPTHGWSHYFFKPLQAYFDDKADAPDRKRTLESKGSTSGKRLKLR